jgi:hypothetical protein
LSNAIRSSLLYFIALREHGKLEVLRRLDQALFDAAQVSDLRREANRFWGLGDSEQERLHAANWNS